MSGRNQGFQRQSDGHDCSPRTRPGGGGEVGVAIFFLTLGLGEVCTGDARNLPSEVTGVGDSGWSVQPKGLVRCHQPVFKFIARMR